MSREEFNPDADKVADIGGAILTGILMAGIILISPYLAF